LILVDDERAACALECPYPTSACPVYSWNYSRMELRSHVVAERSSDWQHLY